jgi:hypothetical protein
MLSNTSSHLEQSDGIRHLVAVAGAGQRTDLSDRYCCNFVNVPSLCDTSYNSNSPTIRNNRCCSSPTDLFSMALRHSC